MLTGIEIAGLVLGAFPLAVEGIKFYANGARTMNEMRHHRHVLDEFIRELDMERIKFVDTCYDLFEDTVTGDELSSLIDDPGGECWKDESFQRKLEVRLRHHCVPHFVQAVRTLKEVLDELNERFCVDEKKVRLSPVTASSVQYSAEILC
jgi:hypothetical protein